METFRAVIRAIGRVLWWIAVVAVAITFGAILLSMMGGGS